jgi:hypothetical protein
LFNRIMAHEGHPDVVAYLRAMVNSVPPTVETEHLDFKSASLNGAAIADNDVKKTWSEALAGFATTGGGVLIWGIDARKPPGGTVDQASGFNLVVDPNGLKSRLQQLHHQATDPPIPGVRVEAIPDPAEGGRGFVVCYVPESDYKPHRSEAAGKRWVMRVGDSFVDVPPAVLRSLFFPQRRSYLFLRAAPRTELSVGARQAYQSTTTFEFRLYNEGPATANSLVLLFRAVPKVKFTAPSSWKNVNAVGGWRLLYPEPVHPGEMVRICDATIAFPVAVQDNKAVTAPEDLVFEVQLYASDQVPQQCRLPFTAQDITYGRTIDGLPTPLPTDRFR